METEEHQQIIEQLKKAGKILIALPEQLTADSLASGLALFLFLTKLSKEVELACSGAVPENLKFLPGLNRLMPDIASGQSLVVALDTSTKKLAELSYQTQEDKVSIFLKSKGEPFSSQDVSFIEEKFPLDLIVTLDCASLSFLGRLFEQHADLFYETPKINIDNKAANELFGAINLVDMTASSVAEILSGLLSGFEAQLIDEDIATCLLTGIIAKTNSFQHAQTTPQAFLKASELVARGARQQEVIKNIFKTKPLTLLKLWGRALARLKTMDDEAAIYSVLSAIDFEKSGATLEELHPTLREFVNNVSNFRLIALVAESAPGDAHLLIALHPALHAQDLLLQLGDSGKLHDLPLGTYQVLEFYFPKTNITQAEHQLQVAIASMPKL
jgi:phosphoesterase RecJ-like protein